MPDSSITKNALALSLKSLMREIPFEKIRVSHICDRLNMNRQSFYYHFQDKYELMNWIFDVDVNRFIHSDESVSASMEITQLMQILYNNRDFYRNALSVQGQNSLREHIFEISMPVLQKKFLNVFASDKDAHLYVEFILDTLINAIIRWISDENCMPPEDFAQHFFSCIISTAKYVLKNFEIN